MEDQFNKTGVNYPLDITDIFDSDESFGGVPDGEELDENKKVLSILEIKTIRDANRMKKFSKKFKDSWFLGKEIIEYCLQISLYLFLRGVDTGYICICYLTDENLQNIKSIKLDSKLTKYSFDPIKFSEKLPSIKEIGVCEYEYELQEAYCNNFSDDNEILVFKIKVNLEKYEKLLGKLLDGFVAHKKISPEMTPKEGFVFLKKIKSEDKVWKVY